MLARGTRGVRRGVESSAALWTSQPKLSLFRPPATACGAPVGPHPGLQRGAEVGAVVGRDRGASGGRRRRRRRRLARPARRRGRGRRARRCCRCRSTSATAPRCRPATSTPCAAATTWSRQIDADGQHSAEHLQLLLDRFARGDVDVVIGSRFLDRDGHYRPSRARKVGMAVFARIASRGDAPAHHRPDVGLPGDAHRRRDASSAPRSIPPTIPDADILILLSPLRLPHLRGRRADAAADGRSRCTPATAASTTSTRCRSRSS